MKKQLVLIFFIASFCLSAQDVHFTQFNKSTFFLNPSLLFIAKKDYKFSLQRRSQWNTVGKPFNTFAASIERKNILPKNSFGVQFLNDAAGEAEFKTTGLSAVYSREVILNSKYNINLGLGVGFFQRSLEFDKLIFQETENYPNINFWFPEINIGGSSRYVVNNRLYIVSGASFFHINKPKQSFLGNYESRLDSKTNLHLLTNYSVNKKIDFSPALLFSKQNKIQELVCIFDVTYDLRFKKTRLKSGLGYRWKDAMIYNFGIEKDDFEFIVSYDLNTSSFNQATNGHGAVEFFLCYIWDYKKTKDLKKKTYIDTCPKYL